MIALKPLLLGLNHLLAPSEWARLRLKPFAGQVVLLEMPPLQLALVATAEGLFDAHSGDTASQVHITLPASTPLLMLQDIDKVMQQARISGNAEYAETLSFIFRHLEWDVEADLAPWVGDIIAHRLTRLGRSLQQHLRQGASNLAANLSEYARDETGFLVAEARLENFNTQVSTLRDDLARLEKRIQQLERQG